MRIPTRSALIGLVLASSVSGALVSSVLAKDFYTRKRVDGRWIHGEFPKKGSQAEKDQAAQQAAGLAQTAAATPAPAAANAPFTFGLHFAPPPQPAAPNLAAPSVDNHAATTGSIQDRPSYRNVGQPERRAASVRRAQQAKVREDAKPEPPRTAEKAPPAPVPPAAPAEPRFASLPGPADTSADPTKRLADALAAKAAALASGVIVSVGDPIPPPKAEPVSVNYDYKTGIKTVTYANGKMDEELFDRALMKGLATTAAQ